MPTIDNGGKAHSTGDDGRKPGQFTTKHRGDHGTGVLGGTDADTGAVAYDPRDAIRSVEADLGHKLGKAERKLIAEVAVTAVDHKRGVYGRYCDPEDALGPISRNTIACVSGFAPTSTVYESQVRADGTSRREPIGVELPNPSHPGMAVRIRLDVDDIFRVQRVRHRRDGRMEVLGENRFELEQVDDAVYRASNVYDPFEGHDGIDI